MRTLIISYDLADPRRNKHALAQEIMAAGHSWARPLDQTTGALTPESGSVLARGH